MAWMTQITGHALTEEYLSGKCLEDWEIEVLLIIPWVTYQLPVLRLTFTRDFMRSPKNQGISGDYFGGATVSHMSFPEFTERNLNSLLMHENPLQTNYYEFIRARGIFDRIESYKMFLEDIRR